MADWPILSVVTFLPLLGAAFIFAIRGDDEIAERNARYVALWTTVITFLVSLLLWINFDTTTAHFQFVEKQQWLGVWGLHLSPAPATARATSWPWEISRVWSSGSEISAQ